MMLELIVTFLALLVTYMMYSYYTTPKGMPPGLKPLPLIGNLLDVAKWIAQKKLQLELTKASKVYGKIFTLELPGQRTVVINSASIAREAVLTKKDDFAGRPYYFTMDYLSRGSKDIGAGDFNATWVVQRKIVHSAMRMYNPVLEDQVCKEFEELSKRLTATQGKPIDPCNNVLLTVMNVICAMVYGEHYEIDNPEFLMIVDYNQKMFPLCGALNLLNLFPFLIHFPIKDSKDIKYVRDTRDRFLNEKFRQHKETYKDGVVRDLTDALIKSLHEAEQEDSKIHDMITEDHVVMTMGDAFSVGFETTATTTLWLMVYMVNYPEIQAKVQEELDLILGRDTLPQWKDRTRLHYLEATISETLRVSSVAALSVPHKAMKDSTLEGYNIPKGTTLLLNLWAMHYDENEWENPNVFDPSRFLDADGKFVHVAGEKSFLPFGAGRRVCVGEALAKQELFLIISRLLHQFKLEASPGSPTLEMIGDLGLVHAPKPFKISFKKRS
jgi:cytochrome P450